MKSKWFPGKSWWSCGGFGWCGWGGCWPDCYCYRPWYYSPCYNVCCEYYVPADTGCGLADPATTAAAPVTPADDAESTPPPADSTPDSAAKIARIVNPAENETTLGFAVNGQTYSLEAGKSRK